MDKDDKPPDVVDWGDDVEYNKAPSKKEIARNIYDILINDEEIQYELNVLLRKHKISEIEKK